MFHLTLTLICCTYFALAQKQHNNNVLSDEYIASINSKQSSWIAGSNFDNVPRMMSVVRKLVSNIDPDDIDYQLPGDTSYIDDNTTVVPDSFDARDVWPGCTSIGKVWDQGLCSSGWALSAASTLTDRICIQKNQTENPILSPEDLLSCCSSCRFGCDTGWPNFAWEYFNTSGITTGGPYGSEEGCKPYSNEPCNHSNGSSQYQSCSSVDPGCVSPCYRACTDNSIIYKDNLYYAEEYYRVYPEERQIKLEIMQNGPVQATFPVWEDFLIYKNGVYIENLSSKYLGAQSSKIIGWGTDENEQAYWLVVNSWNEDWGDGGLFKWLVNNTDSQMEAQVYTAIPYFPESG